MPSSGESWFKRLSAGLITGAADDDPSGIATYSQVGAKFGYATLWTMFLALPLMIAIQMVSARVGRVTGKGLADNMTTYYPPLIARALVVLLFAANVINLGADAGAMGAALQLLVGGPALAFTIGFVLLSLALQVFVPFALYSPLLKVLTLSLFTYVATALVVHVPWGQALKATIIPSFQWTAEYATAIVAILGTTISPYLFSWQAAQEVEEVRANNPRKPLKRAPEQGADAIRRIRIDTIVGMVFSNLVAFFIILTAAVVLHQHGKTDVQSASAAAEALKPLAGKFATWLFAAGIIGTGLLALPVLAGATAFAAAGAYGMPYGLEKKVPQARMFYGVLVIAMLLGAGLNLTPINPFKALYWSAVINGIAAVPMMVMIMLLAQNTRALKEFTVSGWLRFLAWAATAIMALAAIVMLATLGQG